MNEKKKQKLYYSIKEVAKMFNVAESLLRFWEKEFDIISPKKTEKGIRQYKASDIEDIRLVHHLVKERKLTLAGAKLKLKNDKESSVRTAEMARRLKSIRSELVSLQKAFDGV